VSDLGSVCESATKTTLRKTEGRLEVTLRLGWLALAGTRENVRPAKGLGESLRLIPQPASVAAETRPGPFR